MDSVFVLSFEGDDDAVGSGGIAVAFMRELLSASVCGELRVDSYMEDELVQPSIEVVRGRRRRLNWPRVLIYSAELPSVSKRIYLASFPPMKRGWGSYCNAIAEKVASFSPDVVVLFGSIISADPKPYFGRVLVRSNSPKLMREYGLSIDKCNGITGSMGAVQVILEGLELSAVSMSLTTPIAQAHETDVQGALDLIGEFERMFGFRVRDSKLKLDPSSVFASGVANMNQLEANNELDLWASQADFMELRDLVSDLRSSIQELIEEAEEYLREIDEQ
ncbi:MAG: PAC2 family protein [Actinomycetota bacterium]|nr:PAC2 family protein [Actinomycetota bacterium]